MLLDDFLFQLPSSHILEMMSLNVLNDELISYVFGFTVLGEKISARKQTRRSH